MKRGQHWICTNALVCSIIGPTCEKSRFLASRSRLKSPRRTLFSKSPESWATKHGIVVHHHGQVFSGNFWLLSSMSNYKRGFKYVGNIFLTTKLYTTELGMMAHHHEPEYCAKCFKLKSFLIHKTLHSMGSYLQGPSKGGLGISDVSPLSGISGLSCSLIPFFYISSLVFCIFLLLFLSYLFLLLAHSPDLFFPKPPFSER